MENDKEYYSLTKEEKETMDCFIDGTQFKILDKLFQQLHENQTDEKSDLIDELNNLNKKQDEN